MKAIWNGEVIAESDDTIVIDKNHYFPHDTIKKEFFTKTATHTVCNWKGTASYYTIKVGESENPDAAWYYPAASPMAKSFENYVAFWKDVLVTE